MGELKDFAGLFKNNRKQIFQFFRKKGVDREQSEDLTQDTFLNAAQAWDGAVLKSSEAWLHAIAKNIWKNYVRSIKAQKRDAKEMPIDHAAEPADPAHSPLDQISGESLKKQVVHCIEQLPVELRNLLSMKSKMARSVKDMADKFKIKEGTVKSRTHTALRLLDDCIRKGVVLPIRETTMEDWKPFLDEAMARYAETQAPKDGEHLDELDLVCFANKDLEPEQYQQVLNHLAYCSSCMNYLDKIEALQRQWHLTAAKRRISPRPGWPTWFSPTVLSGLAAGLILGVLGTLFLQQPSNLAAQNPLRLELDAAQVTRGAVKLVLGPERDALDLLLQVNADRPYGAYRLELKRQEVVIAVYDQVRPEGGSISLILPRAQVPKGEVTVSVFGIDEPNAPILLVQHLLLVSIPDP